MSQIIVSCWKNKDIYKVRHINHYPVIKHKKSILTLLIVSLLLLACSGVAPLKVAPQVCENAIEPDILPAGLPYRPNNISFIQGGTIEDGDFLFDLWLYCYSPLKPSPADQPSVIEGLGVYGGWYYGGPEVDGHTQDYWGFEPDISPASGSTGPLYKAKGGYQSGITIPQKDVVENIENGIPFRFQIRIESPVGVYGAVLLFKLESTQEGYVPVEIAIEPLNK